jgi:hypothetical protein
MARPKRRFRLNRRRIDLKRTLFLLPNLITQSASSAASEGRQQ